MPLRIKLLRIWPLCAIFWGIHCVLQPECLLLFNFFCLERPDSKVVKVYFAVFAVVVDSFDGSVAEDFMANAVAFCQAVCLACAAFESAFGVHFAAEASCAVPEGLVYVAFGCDEAVFDFADEARWYFVEAALYGVAFGFG